jgi:hypothetical protein
METLEVLKKARAFMMEHYWIKEMMEDGKGGYCTAGAINAVAPWREFSCISGTSYGWAMMAIEEFIPESLSVACWNDEVATCKQDVIDLFDRAIVQHETTVNEKEMQLV